MAANTSKRWSEKSVLSVPQPRSLGPDLSGVGREAELMMWGREAAQEYLTFPFCFIVGI